MRKAKQIKRVLSFFLSEQRKEKLNWNKGEVQVTTGHAGPPSVFS
jgi:hypothetical protein